MAFKLPIEFVQHNARLDRDAGVFDVQFEDSGEVFRAIDDQRGAHRLATLGGAAATGEDGNALLPGDPDRPLGLLDRSGGHHADRGDLVMRGVGRIAAAGIAVELDIPRQFGLQTPFQAG